MCRSVFVHVYVYVQMYTCKYVLMYVRSMYVFGMFRPKMLYYICICITCICTTHIRARCTGICICGRCICIEFGLYITCNSVNVQTCGVYMGVSLYMNLQGHMRVSMNLLVCMYAYMSRCIRNEMMHSTMDAA